MTGIRTLSEIEKINIRAARLVLEQARSPLSHITIRIAQDTDSRGQPVVSVERG